MLNCENKNCIPVSPRSRIGKVTSVQQACIEWHFDWQADHFQSQPPPSLAHNGVLHQCPTSSKAQCPPLGSGGDLAGEVTVRSVYRWTAQ